MVDKIAALRRTVLFGELDMPALSALASLAIEHHLRRNEMLFLAGEQARGLYVVVSGSVRAYRESLDGREQVIHVEYAGATIAEVPVFDDQPMPSNVAAEENSVVLFIDKRDVRGLCIERPEIALAALKILAGRLRRCSDLVATISLQDVGQRIARLLLAEAASRGERKGSGVSFDLPLTKEQIAIRVGSVREVVSRAIAKLHHDGLVTVDGRHVTIPDEDALRLFAGE
jgi:CRP/FNR family transcriptional regulator